MPACRPTLPHKRRETTTLRPRILYVITDPISLRFLRGQLAYIRNAGFEVHLATAAAPELDDFARSEGAVPHAVRLTRAPHLIRDFLALVDLVRLMRKLRPDAVNVSTPKAGLVAGLSAWICRVPVRVYVVRGLRYENATGAKRKVLRFLEMISMRCATKVMFNSRSLRSVAVADRLIEVGRGVVLGSGSGNGLDFGRFLERPNRSDARAQLGLLPDRPIVGFVGRYTRDKGIADLIEAFDRVEAAAPGVTDVLASPHAAWVFRTFPSTCVPRAHRGNDRVDGPTSIA